MEQTRVVYAQQFISKEKRVFLRTLFSVALVAYLFLAVSTQSLAYSTLKYGSRGSEVKTLQTMLNKVDNAKLTVDGIFGNGTKTAVRNYQKKKNLSVDGICGPKTWAVLSAEYEKLTKPAASTLKIGAGRTSPGTLTQGNAFSFSGSITSNYKITYVRVGVYKDSNGSNCVQQAAATPNATSFNISKLDSSIRFGKLSAGSYYFRVVATDSSGTSKTLVNSAFTVKSASATSASNNASTSLGQKTISRNKITYIVARGYKDSLVTKQTTSVNCTKTAGDIAISMWTGQLYQKTGWNNGCTWRESGSGKQIFKIGLEDSSIQSKLNKAGYLAANGAPCVLRLGIGINTGHSVTVVGVKSGANLNAITYDDLLIGDPADGKIKTLREMQQVGNCWHGGVRDTTWGLYVPLGVPDSLTQGFRIR